MLPTVFFAYALIDADKTLLFVNESQFDESVRAHLGPEIEIHPYDTFFAYLTHLGAELKESTNAVRPSFPTPPSHRLTAEAEGPHLRQSEPRGSRRDRKGT